MSGVDHGPLLRRMFDAAIAAAQPARCLPPHLPPPPNGRTIVIGAGKASAAMARALEDHWPGPLEGLVVTRYGYEVPCRRIEIVQAAHPVPDAAGLRAAQRVREMVSGLCADDLVIALVSGGGSSLLVAPADGLTLAEGAASVVGTNVVDLDALIGYVRQLPKPVRAPAEVRIRSVAGAAP